MALTLTTNPVGSAAQKTFAGFLPINFQFKREDLAVDTVVSGTGGIKINISSDLTSYLTAGDSIYVYSEGLQHTYDGVGTILAITSTDITIDIAYVQSATGGYINYLKNYYVEMQCVDPNFTDVNLLPFNLQSDGDAAGNINIDVSIMNDKNRQRGVIAQEAITESKQEFLVAYRQVYTGSAESFTVINSKLIIALYATETPEVNKILNKFDSPKLYLGYPGVIVLANEGGVNGQMIEMSYKELDINESQLALGSLGSQDFSKNGFMSFKWLKNATVNDMTNFIEFETKLSAISDFADPDFEPTDFLTV